MCIRDSLEATHWAEHLGNVTFLVFFAVIIGLALGQSRFKPGWVALIAVLYSLAIVPWIWVSTTGRGLEWLIRYKIMGIRLGISLNQFFRNEAVSDPILFLWGIGLIYWVASLLAGYYLTRKGKPWIPVGIITVATFMVEFYIAPVTHSGIYAAIFTFFILLLVTLTYYQTSAKQWEDKGVQIEQDTSYHLGRGAVIIGLILILVAWNLPTITEMLSPGTAAHAELNQELKSIRDRFSNIVAPLRGPARLDVMTFGEDLALGTGQPSDDRMIFRVEETDVRPKGVRYYWKARSYDWYEDGEWSSTIRGIAEVPENSPYLAMPAAWENRVDRKFIFTIQANLNLLIAPAQLRQASLPMITNIQPVGSAGLDIVAVEMDPIIRQGEIYEVTSSLDAPTTEALRKAQMTYPDWVRLTYLQIPEKFPEKVIKLAKELTFRQTTQYDKVQAITYYLRDNMKYKEMVPEPPRRMDPIEWFLFEQKEGYCNYYATAEVMMLRAVGIPARLAVGYAQGEPEENGKAFQVLSKHSHAWPEVFFDDLGWVEFEPTSGLPSLYRPTALLSGAGGAIDEFAEEMRDWRNRGPLEAPPYEGISGDNLIPEVTIEPPPRKISWIIPVLVVLVLAGAGVFLMRKKIQQLPPTPILLEKLITGAGWKVPGWLQRKADEAKLSPMERAFLVVEHSLKRLKQPFSEAQTPAELVKLLVVAIPQLTESANILLEAYHQTIYGNHPVDEVQAIQAARSIKRIVFQTWLQNILNRSMERLTD